MAEIEDLLRPIADPRAIERVLDKPLYVLNFDLSHCRYDVPAHINDVPAVQIDHKTLGFNPLRAMEIPWCEDSRRSNGFNSGESRW